MTETTWQGMQALFDDIGRRLDESVARQTALMIALRCLLEHHPQRRECEKALEMFVGMAQTHPSTLSGENLAAHRPIKDSMDWILGRRQSMP